MCAVRLPGTYVSLYHSHGHAGRAIYMLFRGSSLVWSPTTGGFSKELKAEDQAVFKVSFCDYQEDTFGRYIAQVVIPEPTGLGARRVRR